MARFFSRFAFLALSLFLLAQPSFSAASKKDINDCGGKQPDVIIKGCTAVFEKSKGNTHTQASALYNRGLAYGRQNNGDLALKDLNAAYDLIKGDEDKEAKLAYNLHLERGKHYYFGGDYAAAETDFRAAKALNNVEPQAALNLAFALNSQEKFEDADKELFWALALNEKDPTALALSGIVNFYLGRYDKAADRTNAALSLAPDMAFALNNRALISYWQGNAQAAMTDLDKVIAAQPNNAWALSLRARIHTERKELTEARTAVGAALAADAKSARAHFTNGLVLVGEGKFADAQKEFDAALALDKTLTEALIESGKLAEAQNNTQAALGWYDKAIAAATPSDQDKVRQEKTKALRQVLQDKIDRPTKLQAACHGGDDVAGLKACEELLSMTNDKQEQIALLEAKMKLRPLLADADRILAIEPKNVKALISRGKIKNGSTDADPIGALADFTVALEFDPKNEDALFFRAVVNRKLDNQTATYADIDALTALHPNSPRPLFMKASFLLSLRDYAGALPIAEKWVTVAPTDVIAWQHLGLVYCGLGRTVDAEGALKKAQAIKLDDPYNNLLAAYIAINKGDAAKAVGLTTAAINSNSLNSSNPAALLARARAYIAAGVSAGALADSEALLKILLTNPPSRQVHAEALLLSGNAKDALKEAEAILSGGRQYPDVLRVKAGAQVALGQAAVALPVIDQLLKDEPGSGQLVLLHSKAMQAQGNSAAASADLEKAVKLMPNDMPLLGQLVRSQLASEQADAALSSLAGKPDSASIFALRGQALLMKGDKPKALEALETTLKLDSNNVLALKLMGDLYADLGSNDLALQYYGRAAAAPAIGDDAKLAEDAKAARAKLIEAMAKKKAGNGG